MVNHCVILMTILSINFKYSSPLVSEPVNAELAIATFIAKMLTFGCLLNAVPGYGAIDNNYIP